MGLCGGDGPAQVVDPVQKKMSEAITRRIESMSEKEGRVNKLLLLGAGQSGKSTIFKQMNMLTKKGYTNSELRQYRYIIHRNCIDGIKTVLEALPALGLEVEDAAADQADMVELWDGENLNPSLAEAIELLWRQPSLKTAFDRRAEYQLNDSVEYFMTHIRRIGAAEYLPTSDDVLRARVRTSGVVSNEFTYNELDFHVFDVGGQRSERRRWLGLFDHVDGGLFYSAARRG